MRMTAMMIAIMIINRTVLVLLLKTTGVIDRFPFFFFVIERVNVGLVIEVKSEQQIVWMGPA